MARATAQERSEGNKRGESEAHEDRTVRLVAKQADEAVEIKMGHNSELFYQQEVMMMNEKEEALLEAKVGCAQEARTQVCLPVRIGCLCWEFAIYFALIHTANIISNTGTLRVEYLLFPSE